MSDSSYDAFLKKYSLAITYLEKRLPNNEAKMNLARNLYYDSLNNKINMNTLMTDVKMFYQGNTLSQLRLNNYIEKYK